MNIDEIFQRIMEDNETSTGDWSRVKYALLWLSDKGLLNLNNLVIMNVLMSDGIRKDITLKKTRIYGTDSYTYELPDNSKYIEVTKLGDNERVYEEVR